MSSIANFSRKYKQSNKHEFGMAEGLLRVLATKMPDADLGEAAITFKMYVIANKLRQANLFQTKNDESADVENLIELMQVAESLSVLANNQQVIKRILSLVEEVQANRKDKMDIVDVMILLSKFEYKDVVNSFNAMSSGAAQVL